MLSDLERLSGDAMQRLKAQYEAIKDEDDVNLTEWQR